MLLGVDVGGTFTDAVLASAESRIVTAKVPSTPADQSQGVMAAIAAVLARAGAEHGEVRELSHGMTVATNALLEGRGARAALAATEGFTDLIALARQDRPELYRLCASRPEPLIPDDLRFAVPERMTPRGPLVPLTAEAIDSLVGRVQAAGVESVAVVLLHSYRHPEHELALADALAARVPHAHVSLSHQVVGTFREFERAATTEIDAALSPLLAGYLRALAARCRRSRLPGPGRRRAARALSRHGRDLLRRLRRRRRGGARAQRRDGRRPPARAADAGHPHGGGRRRIDRLARPGGRPARRAAVGGRRSRPSRLRPRRRLADRDRRQPGARAPGRRRGAGGRDSSRSRLGVAGAGAARGGPGA